ncbi:hypothetical protein [Motiliproteus sp. SC1-56]|uniref:hypothetical protein n=1 Tax=Motiliproteus sp. SC1-56 TaxID=2799565 RepID=UPI001A8F1DDE|nr:hypothetical protein [Motiliproteus sp. SC1-56]
MKVNLPGPLLDHEMRYLLGSEQRIGVGNQLNLEHGVLIQQVVGSVGAVVSSLRFMAGVWC